MGTIDLNQMKKLVSDIQVISESDYRLIAYSKKESLVYHEWLETSLEIDDDTFKSEALELFAILEELKPDYLLPNDKKRKTSISDEINEFLVVNFQPFYAKMKKVALVRNEKLSIQGQPELTMEDVQKATPGGMAEFCFFDNVESAVKWMFPKK
jgi:hypothetical protein